MPGHGKHRRFFQILVIPDDKDEPKAYSVPVSRIKLYKIFAGILVVHLVFGFFAYYGFFHLLISNRNLLSQNRQLEINNSRIFELASAFEDLELSQSKIRTALGLDERSAEQLPKIDTEIIPSYFENVTSDDQPVAQTIASAEAVKMQLGFLTRSKSIIHDIEKSIPTYLPVEGVQTNKFSRQNFGSEGGGGHLGIDIAAEAGTPVRAAADGIVLFAGWTQDLGNLLILIHGNDYYTYYGHNQQLLYQRSAFVKKGDPIALLGNSGNSSAPHLHFEIWRGGVPLDPKNYIMAFNGL